MGHELWTDPLVSWMGAAGTLSYAAYIHRDRSRSHLERMTLLLLHTLAALFILRGWYWLTEDPRLQVLSFVPATVVPIVVTLFVEALLRRHAHPALKLFAAGGSLLCFVLNLVPIMDRDTLWTISKVVTLGTFAWLAWNVVRRDRAAHSTMENRLINSVGMALAVAFAVALTDLQLAPSWFHFRIGGMGGLLFVYVCVRVADGDDSPLVVVSELIGLTVLAGLVTAALALLLPGADADQYASIFLVCLSFVLLYTILGRINSLRRNSRHTSFFRWLLDMTSTTLEELVAALERLPLTREHRVVRETDVDPADPAVMASALLRAGEVCTLSGLRSAKDSAPEEDRDGIEQLIGLLQQHGMTHVMLLSGRPYTFLLLNLPEFASGHNPMLEVALLHRYAALLPRAST
jgi:hypothetical protein